MKNSNENQPLLQNEETKAVTVDMEIGNAILPGNYAWYAINILITIK